MAHTPIVWITWDEVHCDTLGCFGAGTHQTPNVDALAASSHHFVNARTNSPVCLPARCALATGELPHHNGSMSNGFGASLRLDRPNVFNRMRSLGYQTNMVGKLHFSPVPYPYVHKEHTREYEHFIAYYQSLGIDRLILQDGNAVSAWFYDDYSKDMEKKGLLEAYRKAVHDRENGCIFDFTGPEEMHPDRWVADRAMETIAQAEDEAFVWISFSGPHYPINTPRRYSEQIDLTQLPPRKRRVGEWDDRSKLHAKSFHGPGVTEGSGYAQYGAQATFTQEYWDRWQRGYRGNVALLDECLGDVLAAVRARWGDQVLICFTADHGDMAGHHGIWAKNTTAYEDVLHIPFMLKTPGQTQGVLHTEWAGSVDVLPTSLAQACGLAVACDGRDLLSDAPPPEMMLSIKDGLVAIQDGRFKLVLAEHGGQRYQEFYDLQEDPCEFENRMNDESLAEARQRLFTALEADPTLMPRVFYDGQGTPYWFAAKED